MQGKVHFTGFIVLFCECCPQKLHQVHTCKVRGTFSLSYPKYVTCYWQRFFTSQVQLLPTHGSNSVVFLCIGQKLPNSCTHGTPTTKTTIRWREVMLGSSCLHFSIIAILGHTAPKICWSLKRVWQLVISDH